MKAYLLIGILLLGACGTKNNKTQIEDTEPKQILPPVKELKDYKATTFLATLEDSVEQGKNNVYCSTLLLAWNEVRKALKQPIEVPVEFKALDILNKSKSYLGCLRKNEYTASYTIEEGTIKAYAEFEKSLPFIYPVDGFEKDLKFINTQVRSFGGYGSHCLINEFLSILYYQNDNDFLIKLQPKDQNHEILLYKTTNQFTSLGGYLHHMEKADSIGQLEQQKPALGWKFRFDFDDVVLIPNIQFHIKTNFTHLEGSDFTTNGKPYAIIKAWQRTGFMLNEKGAEIESEAAIEAAVEEAPEEVEKPKHLIFDNPFLVVLKRKDNKNPYFVLWVVNTELLEKN